MDIYKELPYDLQLKIFDIYKEEKEKKIAIAKTKFLKYMLLEEFKFCSDTFSNEVEWDINLFMFVRRWEKEHDDSEGWITAHEVGHGITAETLTS